MNGVTPFASPETLRVVALVYGYALVALVGILATCALAGHAGARMRFRWRGPLLWSALALLLMPDQMVLPSLLVSSRPGASLEGEFAWRIIGSHHMRLHLALGVLLLQRCFRHVPLEYEEAALLEGAGPWQGFCRAALPPTTPALALLAIVVSRSLFDNVPELLSLYPGPEAGALARGGLIDFSAVARDWRIGELAGILVGTVPLLIVFLFGLRRWSQGRVSGGICV